MINKRRKMEIILNERRKGKSRSECAMAASIPLQRIVHWYNEGKQYIGEDNIYFYKSLKKIEKELDEKSKYAKDIKEFNSKANSLKRKDFLNYINMGQTRKDSCKFAGINLKLIIRWDSLGRQGVKPFNTFYKEYRKAREIAKNRENARKEKIKNETLNYIRQGKTLKQAATIVRKGKYEKTIINWYNAGKAGNKNHIEFYNNCQKYIKPPVNEDIFAELPHKWKEYFKKLPMNQTGIAWVNPVGKKWVYTRQSNKKIINISDSDIRKLHKKVLAQNQVWGIRDLNRAKKIIKGNVSIVTQPVSNTDIIVKYNRLNKKEFKATINGVIENNQFKNILSELEFFEYDLEKTQTKKINGKLEMLLEFKLDVSLMNPFREKVKQLGWKTE